MQIDSTFSINLTIHVTQMRIANSFLSKFPVKPSRIQMIQTEKRYIYSQASTYTYRIQTTYQSKTNATLRTDRCAKTCIHMCVHKNKHIYIYKYNCDIFLLVNKMSLYCVQILFFFFFFLRLFRFQFLISIRWRFIECYTAMLLLFFNFLLQSVRTTTHIFYEHK